MAELQHIAGLKELQAALKELPDRISKNVLRGAVSAGSKVIQTEAKSRAPVYTGSVQQGHPPPGTLKRAIYQKSIRELTNVYKQTFFVGVRQAKNGSLGEKKVKAYGKFDAYYARWVEFGTSKMPAKPFMRPAFEAKKSEAVEAIKAYIVKRIPEEVAKLNVHK